MSEKISTEAVIPVDVFPERMRELATAIAKSAVILSLGYSDDLMDILHATDDELRVSQKRNPLTYSDLEQLEMKLIQSLVRLDE